MSKTRTFFSKNVLRLSIILVFVLVVILYIYPLVWLLLASLKTAVEVTGTPFSFPENWKFSNYAQVFKEYKLYYITNSFLYTLSGACISLFFGIAFSYAAARMRLRFSRYLMSFISVTLVLITTQLGMIPSFKLYSLLHLRNSIFILPIVYGISNLCLVIILSYGFMRSLPNDMEESAYIDGASITRAMFSIIIPNIKPVLSMLIIVLFMNNWNEFFGANIYLDSEILKPITTGIGTFVSDMQMQYQLMSASLVISAIPTVGVYVFFSKNIESALIVNSGLK